MVLREYEQDGGFMPACGCYSSRGLIIGLIEIRKVKSSNIADFSLQRLVLSKLALSFLLEAGRKEAGWFEWSLQLTHQTKHTPHCWKGKRRVSLAVQFLNKKIPPLLPCPVFVQQRHSEEVFRAYATKDVQVLLGKWRFTFSLGDTYSGWQGV